MFDKLEDLAIRLEEILSELNEPQTAGDPARLQKLMKEQSELQPIVDAYKEYKKCKETVEESEVDLAQLQVIIQFFQALAEGRFARLGGLLFARHQ